MQIDVWINSGHVIVITLINLKLTTMTLALFAIFNQGAQGV